MLRSLHRSVVALLVAAPLCIACGDTEQHAEMSTTLAAAAASPVIHGITVRDAWARIADSAATGGAYVSLVNGNRDMVEIAGAASTAADAVELHETMQHDGMMHMTPRTSVAIAPGDSLVMGPGGLHVMLIGLHRALVVGDSVPLVLQLSSGDLIPLMIPVRTP